MSRFEPLPATSAGHAALERLIGHPRSAVLAVDFDGTLADIVARPEDARAAPGAVEALTRLAGLVGFVAVVTGRPADDVVRVTGLADGSGVEVRGHYGLQRWSAGELHSPPPSPVVEALRGPLSDLVHAAPAGTRLEDKGQSLAVHTRGTADPAAVLEDLRPLLTALAADHGFEAVLGKFVVELRPPGSDKGAVLDELRQGFDVVVLCGDDLGDLPALAAVQRAREDGGLGLVVCVDAGDAPAQLRADADVVLDSPAALVSWLAGLADSIEAAGQARDA